MSEKGKLVEKARKLGREYLYKYRECGPTTLLAVADTLNMRVCDDLFKAMIGLSGQSGGCGGICGATAAIGLKFGLDRKEYLKNPGASKIERIVRKVRDKFVEEYGGYLCHDVHRKLYGRTFDALIPEDLEAYIEAMRKNPPEKTCLGVTENAAGWTVETILDMEDQQESLPT